ncbi:amidohydrolase family protein [Demequina sp.]|uniref:amidohydrolase family protein n=1 Tax=Demequina sp. TaxID=2050685 RepID=UPI003D12BC9E
MFLLAEQLWITDGRIHFERPDDGPFETIEGYVVPGLVDVHCHVGLDSGGVLNEQLTLKQALADRDAGTLLIREPGSPVDTGFLHSVASAPRLIRAGRFIARPKRYIAGYAREIEVEDLPRVAAEEARAGDGWIKLIADWIDRDAGDLTPLWPAPVLKEAIAAAHAEGSRVTAHAFSAEAIDGLLEAGIDCIEHGTGMTKAHMERAAAAGVPVVPTLLQVGNFAGFAAKGEARFPRYAARMRAMYESRYEHVHALWEAGVQLLIGTDAGGEIGHGRLPEECLELRRAGIPDADILAAATWAAREFLGVDAIADGASADLVVYASDPSEDIAVLAEPEAVILRGERVA